jgi:BON domain
MNEGAVMHRVESDKPGLALKIGIAGAIGLGAVVSGLLISRRGRKLVTEAWQGRRRTRLEDRVLDVLWGDEILGRRKLDVAETGSGTIELSGIVHRRSERARAIRLTRHVRDVKAVEDHIIVERRRNGRNHAPTRIRPAAAAARIRNTVSQLPGRIEARVRSRLGAVGPA